MQIKKIKLLKMVIVIKRTTDNKYLKSLENDMWVDEQKEAFEMTFKERDEAKTLLLNTYSESQLKEIVNFLKTKPMTSAERKEIISLLKNK